MSVLSYDAEDIRDGDSDKRKPENAPTTMVLSIAISGRGICALGVDIESIATDVKNVDREDARDQSSQSLESTVE